MPCQALINDLSRHYRALHGRPITELFRQDPQRFQKFSLLYDELFLDYSKNLVTGETMPLLERLLADTGFDARRRALLAGEPLKSDGIPAAMHTVLRHPAPGTLPSGNDVPKRLHAFLDFAECVRTGAVVSSSHEPFEDIVNIGIGGGHIGVALACRALSHLDGQGKDKTPRVHCIASSDERGLRDLFQKSNPKTTLFIISSRSFGTCETLCGARHARDWIQASGVGRQWADHFVAVTVNSAAATEFGVNQARCFEIPEGVAGRMSLWSAAGLAAAVYIGREHFCAMLEGAAAMDEHFATAPVTENMPVILALLSFWYANIGEYGSHAILTYEDALDLLPNYLQQLHMESNGKSVDSSGNPITTSSPVVWGGTGLEGQHAYYQMLHQGTWPVFCEFIVTAQSGRGEVPEDADFARANCFAQARALMEGVRDDNPHKCSGGNRPSNTLLLKRLNPRNFGMLIALYEHKVFTQSALWGTNMFDQWGVELGKRLAGELLPVLRDGGSASGFDAATDGIVGVALRWHDRS